MGTQTGALVRTAQHLDRRARPERVWEEFETFEAMQAVVRDRRTHSFAAAPSVGWVETDPTAGAGRAAAIRGPRHRVRPSERADVRAGLDRSRLARRRRSSRFRLTPVLDGTARRVAPSRIRAFWAPRPRRTTAASRAAGE